MNQKTIKDEKNFVSKGIKARIGQIVFAFLLICAVLFLGSGSLWWFWAWVYLAIYILSLLINTYLLKSKTPEMIAERGNPPKMLTWDKWISGFWSLFQFLLVPFIAALDYRFNWTQNMNVFWNSIGAVIFAAGLGLFAWAMISNTYFSTVVRIQTDRGHQVCQQGPYQIVRHPGYTGTILQSMGGALLLGSWWALLPAFVAGGLIILRTALEDKTLYQKLEGYEEYTTKVRYRLFPGFW